MEQATWDKYAYARPLLQRLLCAHGRRVDRSPLLEDLWPQSEHSEAAERYPKDAAHHLRKVLGEGRLLTPFGAGSGYMLADQGQIWVDADAVEALLTNVEQRGHTTAARERDQIRPTAQQREEENQYGSPRDRGGGHIPQDQ